MWIWGRKISTKRYFFGDIVMTVCLSQKHKNPLSKFVHKSSCWENVHLLDHTAIPQAGTLRLKSQVYRRVKGNTLCDYSWNLSIIQYENKYCNVPLLLYFQNWKHTVPAIVTMKGDIYICEFAWITAVASKKTSIKILKKGNLVWRK